MQTNVNNFPSMKLLKQINNVLTQVRFDQITAYYEIMNIFLELKLY